ncbi:response regulator [Pedobacter psychroterrae]|uniref:Response regulator n=1 Tax=Pedobacter psychroterrae TaxID=2530453 RepID=A0A4R0NM68_9SPHI|nr:response regulator [Pedobacter psychroterrae]TCD01289.1 response regulator [Pedobacter psychroterrae]
MKKVEIACIIDDDPIYIFGTRRIMELSNFCETFMIFHNGKEALDRLTAIISIGEKLPDIILLDLNMPIMDGWEFLDEFTKVPSKKEILIYIVTSSIDPADIERAKKYDDINNYLVKPITMATLKELFNGF